MFQSTFGEQPVAVDWYVVYDSRDGKVLHTHAFIDSHDGPRTADTEAGHDRTQIALQAAERRGDATHLRVMQAPTGLQHEPGTTYRVDVATGTLVANTDPRSSPRGLFDQLRTE